MANELLSYAYNEVNPSKAERLRECATVLAFVPKEGGGLKLHHMNSCRVRLCPICGWRRSLKTGHNVSAVMEGMKTEGKYAYLFLTLTVRNVTGEELGAEIDRLMEGWDRLSRRVLFRRAVKGYYRAMEVTHNVNRLSKDYDTYHPHYHVLLAVKPSYFKGRDYIRYCLWNWMWRRSMRLDYIPKIDIRRVKGDTSAAVAEVAKYAVREDEYIIPQDWDLSVETVRVLDVALADRRFVTFGGKMRDWHRKLNLEDETDGDLVHVDGDKPAEATADKLMYFTWHSGYNQYYKE
jgi:plasmid rolling circle replication initiator protein Rep